MTKGPELVMSSVGLSILLLGPQLQNGWRVPETPRARASVMPLDARACNVKKL